MIIDTTGTSFWNEGPNRGDTPSHIHPSTQKTTEAINRLLNDNAKENPLYIASHFGQHEETQHLLDQGISPNFHTKEYSQTPLHTCYDEKVAKMLIKYGADLNAVNQGGNTPYEHISFIYRLGYHFNNNGDRDDNIARQKAILEVFEEAMDAQDKLFQAIDLGQHEKMQHLLEQGYSPNFHTKKYLETPLHICYDGKMAKLLIAYGADLKAINHNGMTPYEYISFLHCFDSRYNIGGHRDDEIVRQEAILEVLEEAMYAQGVEFTLAQCDAGLWV